MSHSVIDFWCAIMILLSGTISLITNTPFIRNSYNMDNKPKTSPSMLKAINTYNKKSKYIQLKFTQNSIDEYQRIVNYTDSNKISIPWISKWYGCVSVICRLTPSKHRMCIYLYNIVLIPQYAFYWHIWSTNPFSNICSVFDYYYTCNWFVCQYFLLKLIRNSELQCILGV